MARHDHIRKAHQHRHDLIAQHIVGEVFKHLPVLVLIDIQPHTGKFAAAQCVDERPRVDQPAPAGVDKHRAVAHHSDCLCVDHVVGFRRQRAVQADQICGAQQLLQSHIPHKAVQRRVTVLVAGQHRHAEAAADTGHRRADAPRAHNTGRRAVQVVPQQPIEREIVVAHLDIRLADAAVRGQRQRHGVLGHCLGAVARHPQHRDAAPLRRWQINMIVPRAAQQQAADTRLCQLFQHRRRAVCIDKRAHRVPAPRQRRGIRIEIRR